MSIAKKYQGNLSCQKLPDGWEWVTIGDLVNKMVGGCSTKKSDYLSEGILVLNKGHIKANGIVELGIKKRYVSKEYASNNPTKVVASGTVLVTLRDLSVKADFLGLIGRYRETEKALITQGMCSLDLNESVLPNYLIHYSNAPVYRDSVKEMKVGSTQVHLRNGVFLGIGIPLPPLEEQKRIVAEIEKQFSRLDKAVANLKRVKANLKRYKDAVLKAAVEGKLTEGWRKQHPDAEPADKLLERILAERRDKGQGRGRYKEPAAPDTTDLPELPEGWVWVALDSLIAGIEAGKSFKCDERTPGSGEVGVVKVSAVSWGEYDEYESKTCLDPNLVKPELFVKTGDFLFSRANTIELVGACVISKNVTKQVMLSDKILRWKLVCGFDRWVLHYLRSSFGRSEIERLATGNQESMRNIGQDRIRSIRIPLPSISEREAVLADVEHNLTIVAGSEAQIEANLHRADRLRQSILAKAFSGQLSNFRGNT